MQHLNAVEETANNEQPTTDGPTANGTGTDPAPDGGEGPPPPASADGMPEDINVVFPTVTDVYFIIIDCTTMNYVDSVGVKVLQQVGCFICSLFIFFILCVFLSVFASLSDSISSSKL